MENSKDCKMSECCRTHRCKIFGMIFLVIATILTLITFNGMGIFGMFLVGVLFCCHEHMGCKKCQCGCCSNKDAMCSTTEKCTDTAEKKTTTKK